MSADRTSNPRVFIGFQEVAGIFSGLRRGLEELGCEVSFVEKTAHKFGYTVSCEQTELEREIWELCCQKESDASSSRKALELAIRTHDYFVFSAAKAFPGLSLEESLKEIKAAGRKILFHFTGSETRPVFVSRIGYELRDGRVPTLDWVLKRHQAMTADLRMIEKYADQIVCNPLTAAMARRSFVSFLEFGNPTWSSIDSKMVAVAPDDNKPWRVCHAPSWPALKGTPEIKQAIKQLREEGFEIELELLVDVPHDKVLESLAQCDLVVDQLYSDIPLASLGCEAAAMGLPVAVGGYGWNELEKVARPEIVPPAFTFKPEQLVCALRDIFEGGKLAARTMGFRSRDFLHEHWSPKRTASRTLQLFGNTAPPEWVVDPDRCNYAWGVGLSRIEAMETIESLVECFGWESLAMDHRPELLKEYQAYSSSEEVSRQSRGVSLRVDRQLARDRSERLQARIERVEAELRERQKKQENWKIKANQQKEDAKLWKEAAKAREKDLQSWRARKWWQRAFNP